MKVLVADRIAAAGVAFLKAQPGLEVIEAYGSSPEQLLALVAEVDAIAVRSETRITAEVMAAAPQLKVVGRAGVGVDNIDVEAATERGVIVMNTPDGNTVATAELTFTHLLATARPVARADASMKAGQWDRKNFSGAELFQKTLGICGLGRIGTEVAKRALAFGMRVLAYDPYLAPNRAQALGVEPATLDVLLRQADFITVHMPLTDGTRDLIDAAALAKAKKGLRIVNVARGGLVNEAALLAALQSGQVAAAGLDVFEEEPLPKDHPFRALPNVTLTPHLGASTKEAQESVGLEVAEAIAQVLAGGVIRNAVNMPSVDARTLAELRPYLALAGKIGTLVEQITPDPIAKLRITYWGKLVDLNILPVTRAIQRGYLRKIAGHEVNDVNAPRMMARLGIEVEVTKSTTETDYTELMRVEAIRPDGEVYSAEGTLLGTSHRPRIVAVNGREVEFSPSGTVLLVENYDKPGVVGHVGLALGRHGVNIANMSLSRNAIGGVALTALEVDGEPAEAALDEVRASATIREVHRIGF